LRGPILLREGRKGRGVEERTLLLRKGTEAGEGREREERGKGLAPQKKNFRRRHGRHY